MDIIKKIKNYKERKKNEKEFLVFLKKELGNFDSFDIKKIQLKKKELDVDNKFLNKISSKMGIEFINFISDQDYDLKNSDIEKIKKIYSFLGSEKEERIFFDLLYSKVFLDNVLFNNDFIIPDNLDIIIDSLEKIENNLKEDYINEELVEKVLVYKNILNIKSNGVLKNISTSNIILRKDEKVYWIGDVMLYEEKTERKYSGGSRGTSVRIAKGVSVRMGGYSGTSSSYKVDKMTGTGRLLITSKRIIYQGENKSFNINYKKIIDIKLSNEEISFSEDNRIKKRKFKPNYLKDKSDFDDILLVQVILEKVINNLK